MTFQVPLCVNWDGSISEAPTKVKMTEVAAMDVHRRVLQTPTPPTRRQVLTGADGRDAGATIRAPRARRHTREG
ncbi:hypothetical protein, partial [uncultured Rhodoblastus sp.]|uniref:hypothetical protein n=1 Tax=uncultured Rhodoblastus sp. TaxID=543037 RepID=UPI0025E88BB9